MVREQRMIALITGASSGLGFELAKLFVKKEIPVCMVARSSHKLKSALAELDGNSDEIPVYSISSDVGKLEDVVRIQKYIEEENLTVKWIINVAGTGLIGPLSKTSFTDIQATVDTNLLGNILIIKTFIETITKNNGLICSVMSRAALRGIAEESVYCATKWGVRGFLESLRQECNGTEVRLMSVYPGGMNSPFWDKWRHMRRGVDMSTYMKPASVAQCVMNNIPGWPLQNPPPVATPKSPT